MSHMCWGISQLLIFVTVLLLYFLSLLGQMEQSDLWVVCGYTEFFITFYIWHACDQIKCWYSHCFCSSCDRWSNSIGGRCFWQWRTCGGVPQWNMGHCVWWRLGHHRCQCGLSATQLQQSHICTWRSLLWCRQWSNPLWRRSLQWDWDTLGRLLPSRYWSTQLFSWWRCRSAVWHCTRSV